MVCTVSFAIIDSAGDPVPGALFVIQKDRAIDGGEDALQFNSPRTIIADGSGEGTFDAVPGNWTGVASLGTLLKGTQARQFRFQVPNAATADLEDIVSQVSPEVIIPNIAALEAAVASAQASSAAAGAASGRLDIGSFAELATKFVYASPGAGQQIAAPGDVALWRGQGVAYLALAGDATGADFDYTGTGGVKWRALAERGELALDAFGLPDGLVDARAEVQAGIDALEGEALILGPRTYSVEGPIYTGALTGNASAGNVVIAGIGPASIIEKNYAGQGTIRSHAGDQVAAQSTSSFTDMDDLPANITLRDMTIRASEWEISGAATNTPVQLFAQDVLVQNVAIDNWSGWAFRMGGQRHTYRDIAFSNHLTPHPDGPGNPDGVHVRWGDAVFVENVRGATGDDSVALGLGGAASSDQTVKGVSRAVVTGVCTTVEKGSLLAIMAGPGQITKSISARGIFGTAGSNAIKIIADGDGLLRGIYVSGFDVTSTGLTGSNALTYNITPGCEAMKIGPGRVVAQGVDGVNVTFIHGSDGVEAHCVDLDLRIDGTGMAAPNPPASRGAALRVGRDGSGGSSFGATIRDSHWRASINGASGAEVVRLAGVGFEWCDFDIKVSEVADGQTAFSLAGVNYCNLRLKARKTAGATTTTAITTASANVRNNDFRGSDFRGVDTVFAQRPHQSNSFQGVWGVLAPGRGPDLTISDGAITVTHEEHRVDTEGAASTDDLDVITTIPNLPNGLRLVLRSVNSARDITLRDVTALTSDAGAIRAKGFTLGNVSDRVELHSTNGNWERLSSEDNS